MNTYEKKYKDALERAKDYHKQLLDEDNPEWAGEIENIFPELAESDDERVRESIIYLVKKSQEHGGYALHKDEADKMLSWLEKQGKTINNDEFAQGVLRGAAINLITWIDYNAAEGNMCLSNTECKDIEDALVSGNWNKIYDYIKKKLEKQGEKQQGKSALEAIKEEKVDNANYVSVNELYSIGDWVVANGTRYRAKIKAFIENNMVEFEDGTFESEENLLNDYHYWTIKDAKPGDVLTSSYGQPFIYNGYYDSFNVGAYGGLCSMGDDFMCSATGKYWTSNIGIHPATKEQRDALFEKMKEADYKWDKEKKELKKVAQKPADNTEPKFFHEGDWVVYNNDICQIVKREEGCNKLVTVFGIEKELVNERNLSTARLWIISDAKDGDILACDSKHGQEIGIVKKYIGKYGGCDKCFETYCFVDWDGIFRVGEYMGSQNIHPATKEQQNVLFTKMHEVGYEFDAIKKELKNIVPIFNIGDTIIKKHNSDINKFGQFTITDITGGKYWYNDRIICDIAEQDDWELVEKSAKWSEEDEHRVKDTIYFLDTAKKHYASTVELDACINWLKSLKQRMEQ